MSDDRATRIDWLARRILPHEPALRRWLLRLAAQAADVDDIVQETYGTLAALESVAHIRDPRAYLFTTARSILLQQLRRARIVPIESMAEIDQLSIPSGESSAESVALERELLQMLSQRIARLPDRCREVFVLRKLQGYSQREIAQRLGISENTVEKHVGKGLRLLMEALGGSPRKDDDQAPAAEAGAPSNSRRGRTP